MSRLTRDGTAEPSRETKFPGANGDRESIIFPIQLTTSRIGNLTRLILTLAICVMTLLTHSINEYILLYLLFVTIKTCCALISALTCDLRTALFHTSSYYFAFIKDTDRQETLYR